MFELRDVSKTFSNDKGKVYAVKHVDLKIEKQEIFGVIGSSGAGKSTLIRTLNLLERPESGKVLFKGKNLLDLSEKDLRMSRKKIGIIFQNFNLLNSRTVYENVAFPLKGQNKDEIHQKVTELLELVGLSDKHDAYPKKLSGGQKQRVAIARALANDPDVLLCDEATSALDPETTTSILNLLKDLNENLKLTIILITHEMNVIKSICDRVAIMQDGEIKEVSTVLDLFTAPQTKVNGNFIKDTFNLQNVKSLTNEKVYELIFSTSSSKEAIISELVQKFNVSVNILAGSVEIIQNQSIGRLAVSLEGESFDQVKIYLQEKGVLINELI